MNHYNGSVPDTRPPSWHASAACHAKSIHPDAMFPGDNAREIRDAKTICARCPVWVACLEDALRTDDNHHGIRGGLTPTERRDLARKRAGQNVVVPLPKPKRRKPAPPKTLAEAFARKVVRTDDGHVVWYGSTHIQFEGVRYTPLQAAFIIGHGRAPEGQVGRSCGATACFRSDHLTDKQMRGTGTTKPLAA